MGGRGFSRQRERAAPDSAKARRGTLTAVAAAAAAGDKPAPVQLAVAGDRVRGAPGLHRPTARRALLLALGTGQPIISPPPPPPPPCQVASVGHSPLIVRCPPPKALLAGKYVNSDQVPEGRRRTRLFAGDATDTSRHQGPGVEDELFSPGAPAPGNPRYRATGATDHNEKGMYPSYGAIGQLQYVRPLSLLLRHVWLLLRPPAPARLAPTLAHLAHLAPQRCQNREVVDGSDGVANHCESFTMVDLAIGWLLAQPGVSCLLVGASTAAQATRNALIPSIPLQAIQACTKATETLRIASGPEVDQHGLTSRIHGNGPLEPWCVPLACRRSALSSPALCSETSAVCVSEERVVRCRQGDAPELRLSEAVSSAESRDGSRRRGASAELGRAVCSPWPLPTVRHGEHPCRRYADWWR